MIWTLSSRAWLPVRFGAGAANSARVISSLVGTVTAALRLPLPLVGIRRASLPAQTGGTVRVGAPRQRRAPEPKAH